MKKVLVTGGAGFIGSNLCKELLDMGNRVICIDNLFSGNRDNISELLDNPNFRFIKWDITEPIDIECDQIYNLACPASPDFYSKNPIDTLKTCFIGSLNMLELAKKNKARILYTSTSEVYGNPLVHPQTEGYFGNVNNLGPRSCYDEGKRCAETLFYEYNQVYGVDTKIVRIFNTYGPNMRYDDGRAVSNFIVKALNDKPINIYGDGSYTRSLCYVDDTIKALISMMNSDITGPVNIGNPNEMTILDLAKLVISLTKSKSEIVYLDKLPDDPVRRKPDITLANKYLNWNPTVKIESGLLKTIEYFRKKK